MLLPPPSLILQELSLAPDLSVAENILLGVEPKRGPFVRRRELRERLHFVHRKALPLKRAADDGAGGGVRGGVGRPGRAGAAGDDAADAPRQRGDRLRAALARGAGEQGGEDR